MKTKHETMVYWTYLAGFIVSTAGSAVLSTLGYYLYGAIALGIFFALAVGFSIYRLRRHREQNG